MNQIHLINQVLLWEKRNQIENERLKMIHGRRYQDELIDKTSATAMGCKGIEMEEDRQSEGYFHFCGSVRGKCQKI